jgi:hypothetical protein
MSYEPFFKINAIPNALQRAFRRKEHALQFLAGEIRFGLLQQYRKMEGCRGDETEGRASIRWDLNTKNPNLQNVTYSGTSVKPYYALCTFHPEVCKSHVTKFGSFVVSITDPMQLLRRICNAWEKDDRASSSAFIAPVLYNKDELVEPPPYFIAPPCLTYAQKPASYRHDREFRYLLSCKVGTREEPFLTLKVGPCGDICSLFHAYDEAATT